MKKNHDSKSNLSLNKNSIIKYFFSELNKPLAGKNSPVKGLLLC